MLLIREISNLFLSRVWQITLLALSAYCVYSYSSHLFQDEKNQILTTNVWLNLVRQIGNAASRIFSTILQEWSDINLAWNSSEYEDIKDIRIPPKYIWKPDLLMYNRHEDFLSFFLTRLSLQCQTPA